MIDALIVGGGPAGLTAALMMGRARRSVLIVDAGEGRNRFASHSHSFFTRDGATPGDLRAIGKDQLAAYPAVEHRGGEVVSISGSVGAFQAKLADGSQVNSRVVVLATGAVDTLASIPGIDSYWGQGVFQCPFCDGWEHQDMPAAVLADEPFAALMSRFYRNWCPDLTLVTNGAWQPTDDLTNDLERMNVGIRTEMITEVTGDGHNLTGIVFEDGPPLPVSVIWTRSTPRVRTVLAEGLGCALEEKGGFPGFVQVDDRGATSIPGVFAIGDLVNPAPSVAVAVSTASQAASMATHLLIDLDLAE